jgi:hypothetical protein
MEPCIPEVDNLASRRLSLISANVGAIGGTEKLFAKIL